MATTAELARYYTTLPGGHVDHLQRLVAVWGLLADLSFSDLLLFAHVDPGRQVPGVAEEAEGAPDRIVVLGQVRPLTAQTLYRADLMGEVMNVDSRPVVLRALRLGELIEGEVLHPVLREQVRVQCIPVRHLNRTIAVLTRESTASVGRNQGELERAYIEVYNRLVRMVAAGAFPFVHDEPLDEEAPRVGDGAIVLDHSGRVSYASPNAISALHRAGIHGNTEGLRLADMGLDGNAVHTAFTRHRPATEEIERSNEVTMLLRCLPLLDGAETTGALVLLRDVSELRRRDRLLLSKDATIREIHHRVKNNLQTISSLLRLQARRLGSPEAKAALDESVRRIRSIALVHETLSHEASDDIPFIEIVRPLVRMVEEGLVSPERPVRFVVVGEPGILPSTVATPLAVVLTELLQNVVDHAYHDGGDTGQVRLELRNDGSVLTVAVIDDGAGLPDDFDLESSTGLGLSIVRTLVVTEMGGAISMRPGDGAGTVVTMAIPIAADQPRDPRGAQRPPVEAEGGP